MTLLQLTLVVTVALQGCGDEKLPTQTPRPRAAADGVSPELIAAIDRGAGEMGMFEFQAAEKTFTAVVAEHPTRYEGRLNQAIAILNQSQEGAQERAISLLEKLLVDYPRDIRAEYCQALGYLFLGDPARALPRFLRAADRYAADPYAQFYAGQCSELQGNSAAALGFYRRAAELDPYLRSAMLGAQRVAGRQGDEKESQAMLAAFTRLADNPRSHLAEFKYTRMGSLGEVVLVANSAPAINRPTGPVLAPLAAMPLEGKVEEPAFLRSLSPAADFNGDGTVDFIAQIDFLAESRIERRMVCSTPAGGWKIEDRSIDSFRRGRAFWGDFDNDGLIDVAFGRVEAATKIIGGGLWTGWVHQTKSGAWDTYGFRDALQPADDLSLCADLDHDGDLDFVFTNTRETGVLWNLGHASQDEPIAWERRVIAGAISGAQATAADLDLDGDLDLILWSRVGRAAQVWNNDRLWAWSRDARLAAFESCSPFALVAFRRNEDGAPAIAALTHGLLSDSPAALSIWDFTTDSQTWKESHSQQVDHAAALWVTDLSGSGHANIVVRVDAPQPAVDPEQPLRVDVNRDDSSALLLMDAHGGLIERIEGVPGDAELAAIDARGPVVVSGAREPGASARWYGPGSGRMPFAAINLRGRVDPSQQMRCNASGIGTRLDARVGGEWVACDALPWRGAGVQALEPVLVGLGDAKAADFVAIEWTDAVMQSELNIPIGLRTITETQRQISSCPVIFAWNGTKFAFVTDCLGVGGIGYLAGIERAANGSLTPLYPPPRPWERIAIGGSDSLAAQNGRFELRIGEPMEEATYLDAARLVAWDLPPQWQVTFDERMAINGPLATGEPRFFQAAMQPVRAQVSLGAAAPADATAALAARDGVAAHFGEADPRFIGRLAKEASMTLEFPMDIAAHPGEPALLVDGWVEYPYSTTGFAMWQAKAPYQAPSIEAFDPATQSWKVLVKEYGYPAGMRRRAVFPIDRATLPAGCTSLRVRTTMEVYFDAVQLAWFEPCLAAERVESPLLKASVTSSGFAKRIPLPQRLPDYDYETRVPLWDCRMQVGRYTEFGECTPLLAEIDDAVAIFGAGEEVQLQFDAQKTPSLRSGFTRNWVLEVEGWCKDMDLLTGQGAKLDPLPLREGNQPGPRRNALHAKFNTRWAGGR